MDERVEKWLYDIQMSIDEIESYFPDGSYNFFDYRENTMLKRAVERNLKLLERPSIEY